MSTHRASLSFEATRCSMEMGLKIALTNVGLGTDASILSEAKLLGFNFLERNR